MNFTLRPATPADALLIAEISQQTFYDTFAAYNTEENMTKFLEQQFGKGRLMMEVGAWGNSFFLAYQHTTVAGYMKLREGRRLKELEGTKSIEIARLYVVKEFIGKGAGKMLMNAAINIAKEKGADVVWLGVWEKNDRALAFYQSWGFEKFGECDFLLGDDLQHDWLMKKDLRKQ